MPRRSKRPAVVLDEEPVGSGQSRESFAHDLAMQPELLAARLLADRNGGSTSSSPATSTSFSVAGSSKKKSKASGKALLNELEAPGSLGHALRELLNSLATPGTTDACSRDVSQGTSHCLQMLCRTHCSKAMNRFLHCADLERLWRDVQLLDKRAQRKAARIRVQKAARMRARKAARKEARKQEEVEWVSPVPHGLGPSECLCDDCVLWWQQEEKAAKQRVMSGVCAQCGWPHKSIASWRRLCACH
jgi:hypothetical protein